jgi:ribosomal silencing factor RsfS
MKRVCIYPKDVSILTGKSLRHAQKLLQTIKDAMKKRRDQYVTIDEFAEYTGIDIELVQKTCK